MIKKVVFGSAAVILGVGAMSLVAKSPKEQAAAPAGADKQAAVPASGLSDQDEVSYSIGHQIGRGLEAQGITVNYPMVMQGMKDVQEKKPLKMTEQQMVAAMTKLQTQLQKNLAEKAKENKTKGEDFLKANEKKPGVVKTASGLQYKIVTAGKGAKPTAASRVKVNYRGTFIDGNEFDSSAKTGKPAEFEVNGVIPGWTEALQLMTEGSKWQLFIPSELAYGSRGQNTIPGNSVLLFDIELLEVEKLAKK